MMVFDEGPHAASKRGSFAAAQLAAADRDDLVLRATHTIEHAVPPS